MCKRFLKYCIRAALICLGMMAFIGCQENKGIQQENVDLETMVSEDRRYCSLNGLFDYLEEEGAGIPYVYAQIVITFIDHNEVRIRDDSDWHEQNFTDMAGVADISWHTFQTAEEFQEYFSVMEKEESVLPRKKEEYEIEFAYYKYQLEEDTHATDINLFLQERYNEKDTYTTNMNLFLQECHSEAEDPVYPITLAGYRNPNSYHFSQMARKMVVLDQVFYGWECKGITDGVMESDIAMLLDTFIETKEDAKQLFGGWVMDEEMLYWIDHDERVTRLENPTRVFTEVKADNGERIVMYMENYGLLTEADYDIRLYEDGPMLQFHFSYADRISSNDCEMTVTNLDTGELIHTQMVKLNITMSDMVTLADLDEDGYWDMQIDNRNMLWNPEKEIFEEKSQNEIKQRRRQNQEQERLEEEADYLKYVVQSGDTLWGISMRFYGTGIRYKEIEERNAEVLSGYKHLTPGMVLKIPRK